VTEGLPECTVVTGAASGIGLAVSELLTARGTRVVGVDRNADGLAAAVDRCGDGLVPVIGDVGAWETHERAAAAAERAGRLGGWVNNAGIDTQGGAHDVDPNAIDAGLRVLQLGAMYGGAVAVRRMLRGGGSIVNVSSIQGIVAFPRYYVYGAAKAALIQATRSIAVDYAPFGVRCNAVLPGTVETAMLDLVLAPGLDRDEALRREGMLSPMGRIAQPDEIAEVVAFLLSARSSYVTGAAIAVDGGSTARCFPYETLPLSAPPPPEGADAR
jgi:NAD(P)-dependent dehydrogenase (short-subunit alcohol dehydrogenase family)